ncbi:MAG: hypothetical protein V7643_5002 [Mycobacterium sp.]|jgi:hypothetical protein
MLDRAELIAQSHHRQPNPILVHAAIVLPAPTTSEVDVVSRHHVRVITYRTDLDGITADQLVGFFEGWPSPPSPAALLEMLSHSAHVVLAVDDGAVIGFINALSMGTWPRTSRCSRCAPRTAGPASAAHWSAACSTS